MLFDVSYVGAFGAGLLSFLSPCILPIVPFYLCYLAGISLSQFTDEGGLQNGRRRRVVLASVFFSLGILTVFTALGATASVFGQVLREYFNVLRYMAGGLIIILGLHFLGVFRIAFLYREAKIETNRPASLTGAYIIGLAFAFGWTPCVGPVLAAILFAASAQDSVTQGTLLLLVYGIGMTLPFVFAALFAARFMAFAQRFRAHLGKVEKGLGVLLILFGALVLLGRVNQIGQWLLETFPQTFSAIG